jgi:hypothetical protein
MDLNHRPLPCQGWEIRLLRSPCVAFPQLDMTAAVVARRVLAGDAWRGCHLVSHWLSGPLLWERGDLHGNPS